MSRITYTDLINCTQGWQRDTGPPPSDKTPSFNTFCQPCSTFSFEIISPSFLIWICDLDLRMFLVTNAMSRYHISHVTSIGNRQVIRHQSGARVIRWCVQMTADSHEDVWWMPVSNFVSLPLSFSLISSSRFHFCLWFLHGFNICDIWTAATSLKIWPLF